MVVGAAAGTAVMLMLNGRTADAVGRDAHGPTIHVTLTIPPPWAELGVFVGGGIAAVLVVSVIGLLFFRASTDIGEPRTE